MFFVFFAWVRPQWELFPFNFCLKVDRCADRDAWSDARLEGYALSDSRFYQHQVKMRDEPCFFFDVEELMFLFRLEKSSLMMIDKNVFRWNWHTQYIITYAAEHRRGIFSYFRNWHFVFFEFDHHRFLCTHSARLHNLAYAYNGDSVKCEAFLSDALFSAQNLRVSVLAFFPGIHLVFWANWIIDIITAISVFIFSKCFSCMRACVSEWACGGSLFQYF